MKPKPWCSALSRSLTERPRHFGDGEMGRCHRLSCPSVGIDGEDG